jgi:ABC-type transporter Mla subunit MlaD
VNKQAPTFGRLLIMVLFTVSCFGLLLFLWISFGGATPLAPKGYRFQVAVPEANQLAVEADVRTAGVPVGKVRAKERVAGRTLVTVELDRKYAPAGPRRPRHPAPRRSSGERYLELTRGRPGGPTVPEAGGCRTPASRRPSSSTRSSARSTRRRRSSSASGSRTSAPPCARAGPR